MSSRNYDRGYDRGYTSRSQTGGTRDYTNRTQNGGRSRSDYVYGSAAPALDPYEEERRGAGQRQSRTQSRPAKSPRRRSAMSPALIAFMAAALCFMAVCLFEYISLQSEVTNAVEEIASLESELSDLKSENDEALNAIESSVSLDDIKYRAMAELGMTYADEDQIIYYSNEDSDYVRQVIQPE